ncbi:MAG: hypothetical protein ACREDH_08115 [Methylocella sp.]
MPIADKFERKSDAGFVSAYGARAARRQFQVSSLLVLVLALAAIALGILTGRSSAARPGSPHIAETLLDIRG